MEQKYIIAVDQDDRETGKIEKMEAHRKGILHRAFSVFIFNSKGELLLQKRAKNKYHSAGLWTNTCCSHPDFGETTEHAINRRLKEEMGMACTTHFVFKFIYQARVGNGLTEHELDHVYFGYSDQVPVLNPGEAEDWKYISKTHLEEEIKTYPQNYTEWLKISFPLVLDNWKK